VFEAWLGSLPLGPHVARPPANDDPILEEADGLLILLGRGVPQPSIRKSKKSELLLKPFIVIDVLSAAL